MTTTQAFERLIKIHGIGSIIGVSNQKIRYLRLKHKSGKVALEKMEAILLAAGAKVIVEKKWDLPI